MTPPDTVHWLPALSTSFVAEGIVLPLAEGFGVLAVLPEDVPEVPLAPLELELLELVEPELALTAWQAGMPAMAGCEAVTHALEFQLHHMQLLFSW